MTNRPDETDGIPDSFSPLQSPSNSFSARPLGPRDWVPPEDEDLLDDFDYDDAGGFIELSEQQENTPVHPLARLCWIFSGIFFIYALLAAFTYVPGGGLGSFLAAAAGFATAAWGGFLSAPRMEDTDPFDDGARI